MGEYLLPTGQLLVNVHEPDKCRGEWCVIHKPLDTYDRSRLHWRADKGLFEVICEHGVGHTSPEDALWIESIRSYEVHGCCKQRCCLKWKPRG